MFKCSICLGPGPFCVCHQQIWRLLACAQVAWCHRCHYVQEFATRVSPCPAFAMAAPEMVQLLKWHGVGGSTEPSQRFLLGSVVTIAHISEGFRKIYALFGVLFTGLNNVAVYQNRQILGMIVTTPPLMLLLFKCKTCSCWLGDYSLHLTDRKYWKGFFFFKAKIAIVNMGWGRLCTAEQSFFGQY